MNAGPAEHAGDGMLSNGAADRAVDPLGELLRTLSEVLDIRGIVPNVSHIANQLIAHDLFELVVHGPDGHVTLHEQSPEGFAYDCTLFAPRHAPGFAPGGDEFSIVADLGAGAPVGESPPAAREDLVRAGYRSFLTVRSPAGQSVIRLAFLSKRPAAYTVEHVPAAQRIAACLAVAVSHDELARSERERLAPSVRVNDIAGRARSLADTVERTRSCVRAVGESDAWREVLTKATQVAATEATVLLQGESGTGKEVLARFIHQASPRRGGPFVAINCAALPEQLLESEMFGYERGAFTGAHQAKPGQIELASTGVLFLDEVSEMSLAAQAKLLRFLQEREFQRVGATRLVKANVRVIAASNRDLRAAVSDGKFRRDLFYRLQVFDIAIPPLRERRRDIPLLAEAFLRNAGRATGSGPVRVTQLAMNRLLAHSWPGNVRELQNALERAAILSEGDPIAPEHLALHADAVEVEPATDLGAAARQTIARVLHETDWNKSKAARRLGLSRTQLYVRLRKYGLEGNVSAPAV